MLETWEIELWNKIDYYFKTILSINSEIKVNFKFRNRIVLEPEDQNYISILFDNKNLINFSDTIKTSKFLSIEKNYNYFKTIEEEIKNWILSFCSKHLNSILKNPQNEKILKRESFKFSMENYYWIIKKMELGKIGKFLSLIFKDLMENESVPNYQQLLQCFKIKDLQLPYKNFMEYFWTFNVLRNSMYHYGNYDQSLLINSLKILENHISFVFPSPEKLKSDFIFKQIENKKYRFSLEFQEINFFEKSFNLIEHFMKNVLVKK